MAYGDDIMSSVIFDMDGTLLDTQRICMPAWDWAGEQQCFENMGRHIPAVCGTNEIGWKGFLRENYPTLDVEKFSSDARDYIIEHLVVKYMPGAEQLLEFLKSKGVKLALASGSSHQSINHHLDKVGGAHYFDVMIGGTDVQNGKPDPDIFLLAAEKLGVNPKDCYVIEDSANGVRAGYAAGMKCVGIPDIVQFGEETKALLTKEFASMYEAYEYFKEMF